MGWSKFVDMEMDDEEQLSACCPLPMPCRPRYPYGLCISLNSPELEKLGLEGDCDVGDVIDLRAFAVVTAVAINDSGSGKNCRIELQIQKLKIENESTESTDEE